MNLNVFDYDQGTGTVILNSADLAIIKEFKTLIQRDKERADREFTYIYLAIDWKSPYSNYSEQERHEAALQDASITEEEWNDPDFRAACRKYRAIQESNLAIRSLAAAKVTINRFIDYFQSIDPQERDKQTGKPLYKVKDIMQEVTQMSKILDELKVLEDQAKKEMQESTQIRAGAVEGDIPDGF